MVRITDHLYVDGVKGGVVQAATGIRQGREVDADVAAGRPELGVRGLERSEAHLQSGSIHFSRSDIDRAREHRQVGRCGGQARAKVFRVKTCWAGILKRDVSIRVGSAHARVADVEDDMAIGGQAELVPQVGRRHGHLTTGIVVGVATNLHDALLCERGVVQYAGVNRQAGVTQGDGTKGLASLSGCSQVNRKGLARPGGCDHL